jgi:hypothetical protein
LEAGIGGRHWRQALEAGIGSRRLVIEGYSSNSTYYCNYPTCFYVLYCTVIRLLLCGILVPVKHLQYEHSRQVPTTSYCTVLSIFTSSQCLWLPGQITKTISSSGIQASTVTYSSWTRASCGTLVEGCGARWGVARSRRPLKKRIALRRRRNALLNGDVNQQ